MPLPDDQAGPESRSAIKKRRRALKSRGKLVIPEQRRHQMYRAARFCRMHSNLNKGVFIKE
jgi:hypothetical protein